MDDAQHRCARGDQFLVTGSQSRPASATAAPPMMMLPSVAFSRYSTPAAAAASTAEPVMARMTRQIAAQALAAR